jgi:CrcB protein
MRRRQLLTQLEPILLIAVGGFAGANLRQFVDLLVPGTLPGTLAVNVLGSFALGVLVYDSLDQQAIADNSRLVFGTGFLSSFTTYSTFMLDALLAEPLTALGYVGVSYLCGFLAVLVGRWFVGGGDR